MPRGRNGTDLKRSFVILAVFTMSLGGVSAVADRADAATICHTRSSTVNNPAGSGSRNNLGWCENGTKVTSFTRGNDRILVQSGYSFVGGCPGNLVSTKFIHNGHVDGGIKVNYKLRWRGPSIIPGTTTWLVKQQLLYGYYDGTSRVGAARFSSYVSVNPTC